MLLRMLACVFSHIILPVMLLMTACKLAACVCSEMSSVSDDHGIRRTCVDTNASKRKETMSCKPHLETVREAMANQAMRESDPERDPDGPICVIIPAPGVKPEDLKVTVVDGTLTLRGKSRGAGGQIFTVDRTLSAPRGVELEATTCTHADGIITLTIPRAARKSIPVNAPTAPVPTPPPTPVATDTDAPCDAQPVNPGTAAARAAQEESSKGETDPDEWVEMPVEKSETGDIGTA